jgi:radical SAM superfamily enzyme YgiQ (UPF0313 family)
MEVSLINPAPEVSSSNKSTSITPSITPPLGILYLSSILENNGYDTQVCDLDANPMNINEINSFVSNSDVVGLSLTTYSLNSGLRIAKSIREEHPEIFILTGGSHPTSAPEETLDCPAIDCVCIGEGEETIIEITQAIEEDSDLDDIGGIAYKKEGDIVYTGLKDAIGDLDKLPFPAMEKVNLNTYSSSPHGQSGESAPIMSTRGCSFSCNYCVSEETMGRTVRCRSPENIINEIEYLRENCGVSNIMFWDDTLTLNKPWFMRIGEKLKELDITYTCFTRVDTFDDDIARVMNESGCNMIFFGLESSDNEILEKLDKGINREQIIDAFDICHKYGLPKTASFMITPWDDIQSIKKDINFAKMILPEYLYVSILNPLPESNILNVAQQESELADDVNWKDFKTEQAPMNRPVFSFEELSRSDMNELQEYFYNSYYSSEEYANYIVDAIEEPKLTDHLLRIRNHVNDFEKKFESILETTA